MLFLLPTLTLLSAMDPAPCGTPRQAAATFLANLRDEALDARRASRCAETPKDVSRAEKERLVVVLKDTLDAVGARVRLEEIPDSATYLEPRSYEPVVVLWPALPRIRLEKTETGEWMIPAAVVAAADTLYDDAVAFDLGKLSRSLPGWARQTFLGVAPWQAGALLSLLLLGALVGAVAVRLLAWRLEPLVTRAALRITRKDLHQAAWPLTLLCVTALLWLGTPSLLLPPRLASLLIQFARLATALSVVALVYTGVDAFSKHFLARAQETPQKVDDHVVPLVRRLIKLFVVVVGAIVFLQGLDVDVGSLVAGLGIGGLAVALAAKDTIGNFFGSVAIFLDRPFHVGDWIESGDVKGTVESIGFRSTQIRTLADTVVTVPNARLADSQVDNFGARKARRVRFVAGLTFDTAPEQIEAFADGVRAVLNTHPHVDHERIEVHFNDFGVHALEFVIHFYLVRPTWSAELRARHEILMDIMRLAQGLQVKFAFPTRTLEIKGEPSAPPPGRDALLEVIRSFSPGGRAVIPPGPRILPSPAKEPAPPPQRPEDAHLRQP